MYNYNYKYDKDGEYIWLLGGIIVGFLFIILFLAFWFINAEHNKYEFFEKNSVVERGDTEEYYEILGVKTVKDDTGIIVYGKVNEKDYKSVISLEKLLDKEGVFFDNYTSLVKAGKDYIKRDINFLPEDIFDLEGSYAIVVKNGRILDSFKITEDNIDSIEDIIRYEEVEKK